MLRPHYAVYIAFMRKRLLLSIILLLIFTQCSATAAKRSFGEVVDDNVIALKIRSQFMQDKTVHSNNIKLKVWRGTVTMSGVVEEQKQINRAINLAEKQKGVKQVKSYLVLKQHAKTKRRSQKKTTVKKEKQKVKKEDLKKDNVEKTTSEEDFQDVEF